MEGKWNLWSEREAIPDSFTAGELGSTSGDMPSPAGEDKDQYLLWWNHEEAVATESGIEY